MAAGAPKINILETEVVDTHMYTEEDLFEYAAHLGMDLEYDRDLMWIATAGLYASLPKPWLTCQAEGSDDIFYFNPETRESVWEHPSDEFYREMVAQTVANRVTVAVSLRIEESEDGAVTVVGTKLSGEEAVRVRLLVDSDFASARAAMIEGLALPKNTVARFFFEGTALGHSNDESTMAFVFGLSPQTATNTGISRALKTVPRPSVEGAKVDVGLAVFADVEAAQRLGATVDIVRL